VGRRRFPEPVFRVCLQLSKADHDRFKTLYPAKGVSSAVRALMRAHLLRLDARNKELESTLPEITLEFDDV
jgi:hypothetical protein